MKEQGPINNQNELTSRPNSSNLEREGEVFMADGPNSGPEPEQPPIEEIDRQPSREEQLEALIADPDISLGVRRAALESLGSKSDENVSIGGEVPVVETGENPKEASVEELSSEEVMEEILATISELPEDIRKKILIPFKSIEALTKEDQETKYKSLLQAIRQEKKRVVKKAVRDTRKVNYRQIRREARNLEELRELKEVHGDRQTIVESLASSIDSDLISNLGASKEKDQQVLAHLLGNPDLNAWMAIGASPGQKGREQVRQQKSYIEEIVNNANLSPDEKKAKLKETVSGIAKNFLLASSPEQEDQYNPVRSVQDLGRYIASAYGNDIWGEDGIHPVIDRNGKLHAENLILWVREQATKLHTDNRNDAISPLGSIHVRIGIGDVSLYDMVRAQRQRYMKDEETGAVLDKLGDALFTEAWGFGQIRNYDLAYYQKMRDDKGLPEAINAIHARNDITNGSTFRDLLKMGESYGGDAKVGRAALFTNDIYYNLSDWQELVTILGGEGANGFSERFKTRGHQIKREVDALVSGMSFESEVKKGKYIQEKYQERIISEIGDITTFTKDDFRDAIRVLQSKKDWEDIDTYEGFYDKDNPERFYCVETDYETGERITDHALFDAQGRFDIINFARFMNIYNYANPEQSTLNLLKELVRQKAAQKFNLTSGIERTAAGKEAQKAKWQKLIAEQKSIGRNNAQAENEATRIMVDVERHADRISIEFAEHLAYALQRPYGGSARNDINRRGYNALTKLSLEEYLIRQSAEVRAGPVGVREAVGIYRNVGPDMYTALRTESRQSPIEIFKEVRKMENVSHFALSARYQAEGKLEGLSGAAMEKRVEELREAEIKNIIDKLKFAEGAESDVAGNVQGRGFQMFHNQTGGQRVDLDKLVSYDAMRGVQLNVGEIEEKINDGMIKPARYFGSTNGAMKFSSMVRRLNPIATKENGIPTYEDVTLAEATYSPEVLREFVIYNGGQIAGEAVPIINGMVDFTGLSDKQKDYLDYGKGRMDLVKIGLALDFGAILAHHRAFRGYAQRWGYVRNEAFFGMLKAMQELEADPNNPGRTRIALDENGKPKRFFDEKLMKLMRQRSNSSSTRLLFEDIGLEAGGPLMLSIIQMITAVAQETLRE